MLADKPRRRSGWCGSFIDSNFVGAIREHRDVAVTESEDHLYTQVTNSPIWASIASRMAASTASS